MKHKFIKFLKERHALKEYLMEITPHTLDTLNVQFKDGGEEFVLQDGCIFFYKTAKTDIDWDKLNREWTEMLIMEEAS